jgi:ABC-type amino acid transport substrate-binding protein
VSQAITKLKDSGELDKITEQWMGADTAPELN